MTVIEEPAPPTEAEIDYEAIFNHENIIPTDIDIVISARNKAPYTPIMTFLRDNYGHLPLGQIESIFGFAESSTLYGGRPFGGREFSNQDVEQMNDAGIGLRLPLSNHWVSDEEFEENIWLLEKYHRRPNSVIITRDDLAKRIRNEFPDYQVEASVIKHLATKEKIEKALEIYDTVIPPMATNLDAELLKSLEHKDRITLFANAGCALTCPAKICYPSISKANKFTSEGSIKCSAGDKPREVLGVNQFNLVELRDLGFKRFKMLRSRPDNMTGF